MDSFFGMRVREVEGIALGISALEKLDRVTAEKRVGQYVLFLLYPGGYLILDKIKSGLDQVGRTNKD